MKNDNPIVGRMEEQMNTKQIVFRVGTGEYGMDVTHVNAIETLSNVVPVPNAAHHILGIMNLRGDVLPVYSLRTKFGLEEVPQDDKTKIIVTSCNGIFIAFKVDEVKEIVDLQEDKLSDFPEMARSEETRYADKVAKVGDRLVLLINHNNLLQEGESEEIAKFVEATKE